MTDISNVERLLTSLRALRPWSHGPVFSAADWKQYIEAARLVQSDSRKDVDRAFLRFLDEGQNYGSAENETRLFLLLRVVFDLPECVPASQRQTFKGLLNWPEPDASGSLNLSWPVSWQGDRPRLLARFKGAEGPRYGAIEEYHYFLDHFKLRNLDSFSEG